MITNYNEKLNEIFTKISTLNAEICPSKFDVIDEEGTFRLLNFQAITPTKHRIPLLIVSAFINRPYVLDMHPEISVVRKYLDMGFDVYMIDWGYPTVADRFIDLDDYLDYIDRSLWRIQRKKSVQEVSLHGYCLGGTLSAIYAALHAQNVRNLVLQATPIDFHTNNPLALWARSLDPDPLVGAYHVAPGSFLNDGFLLINPAKLILGKYQDFLNMTETESISDFLRMEHWIFDSPAVPGEAFRHYIKDWYRENLLVKGEFWASGHPVDLRKITASLLVLVANHDDIVPPESQKAILGIAGSMDKEAYEIAKGHVGITTSRDSHKQFWPRVVRWLELRSD